MASSFDLHTGDALDVLPSLSPASIDCIVTSPPYAGQRSAEYGGISEDEYPTWFADRLDAARSALTDTGSVAFVIRPHIRRGQLSDYLLRTRLEIRSRGWYEHDEWIWDKVSGPPTGPNGWPRRSWEHIIWCSPNKRPYCNPLANGQESGRIGVGVAGGGGGAGGRMYVNGYGNHKVSKPARLGRSRGTDIARFNMAHNTRGDAVSHPAPYPPKLATWIIRYICPPCGTVLDPFCGSGSTGVAAFSEGMNFVGVDIHQEYVDMTMRRLSAEMVK